MNTNDYVKGGLGRLLYKVKRSDKETLRLHSVDDSFTKIYEIIYTDMYLRILIQITIIAEAG